MFNKFLITDIKTGAPSYTLSVFLYGFVIVALKLIFSGIQITENIKLAEFSGVDFAAAIGALGSIYVLRKNTSIKPEDNKDSN